MPVSSIGYRKNRAVMTAAPVEPVIRIRGRVQLNKTMVLARVERQHALIEALRTRAPSTVTGARLATSFV